MNAPTVFHKTPDRLIKSKNCIDTSTASKSLDTALDSVIQRYMSNLDVSPCLSFNGGIIIPKQQSAGTNECLIMALTSKHK